MRCEVDIAYDIRGALAEEIKRTPGLTLKPVVGQVTNWVEEPGIGLVAGYVFSGPYEDVKLKAK